MSVWSKVKQKTKSGYNKVSDKFNNTRVGKFISNRKARRVAENDAKIEKLLNSKTGKFNVGLTGFADLGSIRRYKRNHKGKLSKYQLAKLKLAKKAIRQRKFNTAKVIGFGIPLLKVLHSLISISRGDPKNNPVYSTTKATVEANSNVEIAKASADKDTYRSLQQKLPMQEYNNTLVKVYGRSKLDSTDRKLDAIIERLDDLAKIDNDTRKNSLAQLELSQKEFAAKANRSDQLLTSIKKIQATSTKSIETSQNKSSGLLKKVVIGGSLLALALGPLRSFINKYKNFKDEVAKEETEGKLGLVDRIIDSVKQIGQSIADVFTNKSEESKSDTPTDSAKPVSDGSNQKDSNQESDQEPITPVTKDPTDTSNDVEVPQVGDQQVEPTSVNPISSEITPDIKATAEDDTNKDNKDESTITSEDSTNKDSKDGGTVTLVSDDIKRQLEDIKAQLTEAIKLRDTEKVNALGVQLTELINRDTPKDIDATSEDSTNSSTSDGPKPELTEEYIDELIKKLDENTEAQKERLKFDKDQASDSDDSVNEDVAKKDGPEVKQLTEAVEEGTKAALEENDEKESEATVEVPDESGKPKIKRVRGKGILGVLGKIFGAVMRSFGGVFGTLLKLFLTTKLIQTIVGGISGLWQRFRSWFGETEFGKQVLNIIDGVKTGLQDLWSKFRDELSKTEFGRTLLDGIDKVWSTLSSIGEAVKKVSNFLAGRSGAGNDNTKAIAAKTGMGGLKGDYTREELRKIRKAAGDDGKLSESDFKNLSKDLQARIKNQGDYDYLTSINTIKSSRWNDAYIIGDKKHLVTEGGKDIGNSTIAEISDIINRGDSNLVTRLGTGELQLTEEGFNQLSSKAKVELAKKTLKDSDEEGYVPAVSYDVLKTWADSDEAGAEFKSALEERQQKTRRWVAGVGSVAGGIAAGAALGSVVPVFGTAIGAVAGGILAGITGYYGTKLFQGSGDKRADKLEAKLKELPQDAEGTDGHPGGPAIVGDGGEREVVVTPDKKTYITPDTPTLVDLPAGSKVIPEHKLVPHYAEGTPTTEYDLVTPWSQWNSSLFQYNPAESSIPYMGPLAPEVYQELKESNTNVGKHFDYDKAVKTLKDNSTKVFQSTPTAKRKGYKVGEEKPSNQSYGLCAGHVRRAIEAGGVGMLARPSSAYQYSSFLPKVGFKEIDIDEPKKPGDILVEGKTDKHPHGHIAMWDGSKWVSDFVQSRADGKVHMDGIHGKFSRFRIPEGDIIKPYKFSPEDQINMVEADHETNDNTSLADAFDFRKMGEAFGEMINSFTKPSTELGGDIDIKPVQSKPVNLEMSKDDSEDNTESTKSQSPTILQPITNNNNQRGGDTINNITVNNNYTVDSALGSELRG